MNTDNQSTPDDSYRKAWKQAFDEAAETPPPRVWSAIERQLNTDDRARIIPLWWAQVRPWTVGMAATIAVVVLGWWIWQNRVPAVSIAQRADSQDRPGALVAGRLKTEPAIRKPNKAAPPVASQPLTFVPTIRPELMPSSSPAGALAVIDKKMGNRQSLATNEFGLSVAHLPLRSDSVMTGLVQPTGLVRDESPALPEFGQTKLVAMAFTTEMRSLNESNRFVLSVDRLSGKPLRSRQPAIQRVVWFRNEEVMVEPAQSTPGERETWASVSMMPSAFNPAVALPAQPIPSLSTAYVATASYRPAIASPALRSESGVAIAMQVSAGAQLSKRWSVETGIGYLQAQSTVVSPVQVMPLMTVHSGTDQTLYTAVVQRTIDRKAPSAINNAVYDQSSYIPAALYSAQTEGHTRNSYSFVQVPVQVGYQLRPRRKLGLSLLGGLLTNWFVRNAVGETLVVKPSDNVYRSLTLAGTAGARFRYRSSRRWSASLAGVYQQSLQVGTQADVSLETRPHTVGVSFGMDYHF